MDGSISLCMGSVELLPESPILSYTTFASYTTRPQVPIYKGV